VALAREKVRLSNILQQPLAPQRDIPLR
jgi:hypothetical protein